MILDGKKQAAAIRADLQGKVAQFVERFGRAPSLHVVLASDDPASAVYVRNKERAAREVGMSGEVHRLAQNTAESEVISLVTRLAADPIVDGILVQLPLGRQIDESRVLSLIPADKDVDGFHPVNVGLLASGRPGLVPCTPLGCLHLLDHACHELALTLAGRSAVVVGRSNIVGKPVAQLLLRRDMTVTIAHSKTQDLRAVCRQADVLVAAVGRAEMIDETYVKKGVIVIDVGINRIPGAEPGTTKLVGDVAFDRVAPLAAAITPVPGGVGPLTIAMLLANTLIAATRRLSPDGTAMSSPVAAQH